jgi:hypothetical protein
VCWRQCRNAQGDEYRTYEDEEISKMLGIRKRIVVDSAVWTEELDRKPLASETGYPPSFIAPTRQIKEVEQNNINGNIVTAIEGGTETETEFKKRLFMLLPMLPHLDRDVNNGRWSMIM